MRSSWRKLATSFGATGMSSPRPSVSRRTVTRTNAVPAGRDEVRAAIRGHLSGVSGAGRQSLRVPSGCEPERLYPGGDAALASSAMSVGPIATTFDPHSPEALAISTLFGQTLVVCGVIFAVVAGLVGACVVRFRAGKRPGEPEQVHGNTRFEIAWTLVPLAIVIGLFVADGTRDGLVRSAADARAGPRGRRAPVVVGGAVRERAPSRPTSCTCLSGKDLLVRVESADVIHDFWVPAAGAQDRRRPGPPVHDLAPGRRARHLPGRVRRVLRRAARLDALRGHRASRPPSSTPGSGTSSQAAPGPSGRGAARGGRCSVAARASSATRSPGTGTPARVAPDLTHLAEPPHARRGRPANTRATWALAANRRSSSRAATCRT